MIDPEATADGRSRSATRGTLYVVGTPLGNLEDLTPRARRVLGEVALIAAEDTRDAGRLLQHLGISARLLSLHEHNEAARTERVLLALTEGAVALISEAGMPGIADPGFRLVRAAAAAGHTVTPVPGPTALATALAVSGLPADQFVFLGFLPRRPADRRALLTANAADPRTLVAYEAPHRITAALADALASLGDRDACLCRELTKKFEEIRHEALSASLAHFTATEPRGEFTLVIAGAPATPPAEVNDEALSAAVAAQVEGGVSARDAIARVAVEFGVARRRVWDVWHRSDAGGSDET